MAERLRANTFGRYYVTTDCDGCGLCVEVAPMNFGFAGDRTYCAIYAQPLDARERETMERLLLTCPRLAIRADGDVL
ncbi:MAG TPA: ferredoxin [Vicinamibacteria bacterium]|nr:ferredoxin [Vicinamibacteria bacterium]